VYVQGASLKTGAAFLVRLLNSPAMVGGQRVRVLVVIILGALTACSQSKTTLGYDKNCPLLMSQGEIEFAQKHSDIIYDNELLKDCYYRYSREYYPSHYDAESISKAVYVACSSQVNDYGMAVLDDYLKKHPDGGLSDAYKEAEQEKADSEHGVIRYVVEAKIWNCALAPDPDEPPKPWWRVWWKPPFLKLKDEAAPPARQ
jgi:hypothetical protein